jgi:hypothetical protein
MTKLGLATCNHDTVLKAYASKTCFDGNEKIMHRLNPQSYVQIPAPGNITQEFEQTRIGGWLCKTREDRHYSVGGYVNILTSKIYIKIGCATSGGIISCNLAYPIGALAGSHPFSR